MDIIISSILEQVAAGVGVFIAAIIGVGIRYLFHKVKNEKLREYGDLLAFYAEKAVKAVAQAEADVLKEAAADGKLSADEKAKLKSSAVDALKAIAPDAILKFMEKGNSDLDKLLEALVESAVRDSNGGNGS